MDTSRTSYRESKVIFINSHFQEFRKFSGMGSVKMCRCICHMKAALLSLLLKHSQDQTLHINTGNKRECNFPTVNINIEPNGQRDIGPV